MIKQIQIPVNVGIKIESNVYFILFVSLLIVKQVVEQGKCIIQKIIVHIAVLSVHPLFIKSNE